VERRGTHVGVADAPVRPSTLLDRTAALRHWIGDHRLILAAGIAAAVPILVSTIHDISVGWAPFGDDAYISIHSFDVLTSRSPLVGQWSSGASEVVGKTVYSPGPLLFWLLTLPAHLSEPRVMTITMGALNVAAVVGVVALARRRGGRALMFAAAIAVPVMLASLPFDTYDDVWNSSVGLLPLVLLTFLAWSLACGEYRLLPVTVLVASFVAQAHLTYVAPVIGLTAAGLAGLAVWLRRERELRRPARRWVAAAVAVLVVCWSAPVIDQLTNSPGNLSLIVQSATTSKPTLGFDAGWRAVVHTVGIAPWWLESPRDTPGRITDLGSAPGRRATGSAVLVLAGLGAVTAMGWRRRRADVAFAGVLGLVLSLAVGLNGASTPKASFGTLGYTFRWASPAGMCVWLLLGWAIVVLLPARQRAAAAARVPASAAIAGVGLVLVVAAVVSVNAEPHREAFRALRTVNQRVGDTLPRRATRVDATFAGDTLFMAIEFQAGVVYSLRREGWPVVAPGLRDGLGPDYAHGAYDQVLSIDVDRPPRPGTRLLARVIVPDPVDKKAPPHVVSVDLAPAEAGRQ
jgi:hypothetical protein